MLATVRARITLLATAVAAVLLLGAAALLLQVLDAQLTQQSDGALRGRALELAGLAEVGETLPASPTPVTDEGLVQVVAADGRVLAASPNLGASGSVERPSHRVSDLTVREISAPDDHETERYRVWRVSAQGPDGVVTVFVGVSLESTDEATRALRTELAIGLPVMLALLAVGTWLVVGRALGRVERVRHAVAAVGDDDLSRRLEPGPPDEVGRLVTTLNEMLGRIENGRQRQRDFVADASHELQSPLTAFRAQLEVARAHPDGVAWPELVRDLLDDTDRMQRLVGDLLLLAAAESSPATHRPVDLRSVAEVEVARATGRGPAVVLTDGGPLPVLGDEDQLSRVIRNVLDNAVDHAVSRITIEALRDDGVARVRISDDGPGVPGEHSDLIFERFHRADVARTRGRGTGLGLAIARSLARAHGGDVVLAGGTDGDTAAGGAAFELRLPLTPSA